MAINLKITAETLDRDFERIANDLMNCWALAVNETHYRLTEIEFYCKSVLPDGPIKDPYTHGHSEQLKSGTWYFHGSGLDLTFGTEDFYGGILIRGIQRLIDRKHITGPLNSITEIMSSLGSSELKKIDFGLLEAKGFDLEFKHLIKAPRVGLNPINDPDSHQKHYRYLIFPQETKRDKSIIIDSLVRQGIERKDAEKLVYK
jgi:hypothetical protein